MTLCAGCPQSYTLFAKKGAKPVPYLSEAYALTEKQIEFREEEHAKGVYDKGKKLIEGFMASHNKKFEGK